MYIKADELNYNVRSSGKEHKLLNDVTVREPSLESSKIFSNVSNLIERVMSFHSIPSLKGLPHRMENRISRWRNMLTFRGLIFHNQHSNSEEKNTEDTKSLQEFSDQGEMQPKEKSSAQLGDKSQKEKSASDTKSLKEGTSDRRPSAMSVDGGTTAGGSKLISIISGKSINANEPVSELSKFILRNADITAAPPQKHAGSRTCPENMPKSDINLFTEKSLEMIKLVGQGSYSKVYLCRKTNIVRKKHDGRLVKLAMKIVDTSQLPEDYVDKFLPRELKILSDISHPHIIKMYMLFQRNAKYFMCMRFAERGDLLDYILAHGAISENRARFWTNQIARAVEYLHTMNVVHRDIKTENLLITESFNLKLCDFGFARFVGEKQISSTYCGSLSYSAPEVLQFKPYDCKKADLWSLGVVIFVMLVKRFPYQEQDNAKILVNQQLAKAYSIPAQISATISEQSKIVIKNLLEPMVKKRWSINELLCSQWINMDTRFKQRTSDEEEAFERAKTYTAGGTIERRDKKRGIVKTSSIADVQRPSIDAEAIRTQGETNEETEVLMEVKDAELYSTRSVTTPSQDHQEAGKQ